MSKIKAIIASDSRYEGCKELAQALTELLELRKSNEHLHERVSQECADKLELEHKYKALVSTVGRYLSALRAWNTVERTDTYQERVLSAELDNAESSLRSLLTDQPEQTKGAPTEANESKGGD